MAIVPPASVATQTRMVRIRIRIPFYLVISRFATVTSSVQVQVHTNTYHTLSWLHQKLNRDEVIELIFKNSKSVKKGGPMVTLRSVGLNTPSIFSNVISFTLHSVKNENSRFIYNPKVDKPTPVFPNTSVLILFTVTIRLTCFQVLLRHTWAANV